MRQAKKEDPMPAANVSTISVTAIADPTGHRWVEAAEAAENLTDALQIINQWISAGEIEQLTVPGNLVDFVIRVQLDD